MSTTGLILKKSVISWILGHIDGVSGGIKRPQKLTLLRFIYTFKAYDLLEEYTLMFHSWEVFKI